VKFKRTTKTNRHRNTNKYFWQKS